MTVHVASHEDAETRKPARWATYPGDQRTALGQVVGPTTVGDGLTLVAVEFDDEADTSRCGFTYGVTPGAHLPPWLQPTHPVYGVPTGLMG